jgi:hypothetical protein
MGLNPLLEFESQFPLLIRYLENNPKQEAVVVYSPEDINSGVSFRVLETRYSEPETKEV